MGSQAPSTSANMWRRPRVYGTIVGLYLFVMSAFAIAAFLIPFYRSYTESNICAASASGGRLVGCSNFIVTFLVVAILSAGVVGSSIAAAIMLIRGTKGEYARSTYVWHSSCMVSS